MRTLFFVVFIFYSNFVFASQPDPNAGDENAVWGGWCGGSFQFVDYSNPNWHPQCNTCPDGSQAPANNTANCPVLCPDGSQAPNNNTVNCPVFCPNGQPAPNNNLASCESPVCEAPNTIQLIMLCGGDGSCSELPYCVPPDPPRCGSYDSATMLNSECSPGGSICYNGIRSVAGLPPCPGTGSLAGNPSGGTSSGSDTGTSGSDTGTSGSGSGDSGTGTTGTGTSGGTCSLEAGSTCSDSGTGGGTFPNAGHLHIPDSHDFDDTLDTKLSDAKTELTNTINAVKTEYRSLITAISSSASGLPAIDFGDLDVGGGVRKVHVKVDFNTWREQLSPIANATYFVFVLVAAFILLGI